MAAVAAALLLSSGAQAQPAPDDPDSEPVELEPPNTELDVPPGTAVDPPAPNRLLLTVTRHAILLEEQFVALIEGGEVPDSARLSIDSPIIPALASALESQLAAMETTHQASPDHVEVFVLGAAGQTGPALVVVADRETHFSTLAYALMTASSTGVRRLELAVRPTSWRQLWEGAPAEGSGAGVIRLVTPERESPDAAQAQRDEPLPRIALGISKEGGFLLFDLAETAAFAESGLQLPMTGCPAAPGALTVCPRSDAAEDAALIERLDFRGLYNRLVEVRNYPVWSPRWDAPPLYLVADPSVPLEVVVRTLDVARFLLEQDAYADDTTFHRADYREEEGGRIQIFDGAVLLIPRVE
jgi:hypothetical protein